MRERDIDAVKIGVYYEDLRSLPLAWIQQAAQRWRQRGRFFPTTGQWAQLAREIGTVTQPPAWTAPRAPACETCDDTGWMYRDCRPGSRCGAVRCLERGSEWEHVYVVRCSCFTSPE